MKFLRAILAQFLPSCQPLDALELEQDVRYFLLCLHQRAIGPVTVIYCLPSEHSEPTVLLTGPRRNRPTYLSAVRPGIRTKFVQACCIRPSQVLPEGLKKEPG
ncbi:hypothetical protein C8R47DRAFT_1126708 [Mycena vitilis]|nr:hypothetical protein C8R47DRAFT_1126708 [Mycena vitilis]